MTIRLEELSLVLLVGPSGAGKSRFARRHFLPTEIVSSDVCRGLVSDDENDQAATADAFAVLHEIVRRRLARGRLTVVDATNVQVESRRPLLELAREFHVAVEAIVLDLPEQLCLERNQARPERRITPQGVRIQTQALRRSMRGLEREGIRHVTCMGSVEEVEQAVVERLPMRNNRRLEAGPFDIAGDVHGCFTELAALMTKLGYTLRAGADGGYTVETPPGRRLVLVGDLVDRGPASPAVLRLVMTMVAAGQAFCVPGNHDVKLVRALRGKDVKRTHGLAETLEQLDREPAGFREEVAAFIEGLSSHLVFDEGRLVVAHAGLKESMHGRSAGPVREFALFGETTGETDEFGLPVRLNWAADYRGKPLVVFGHTPQASPLVLNNTVNVDTGCVFGGYLTALRYPERELVSVPAQAVYYERRKPFAPNAELARRLAEQA